MKNHKMRVINSRYMLPVIFLLLTCFSSRAQVTQIDSATRLPEHPRILLLKDEERSIRQLLVTDPTWKKIHQPIIDESNKLLAAEPVKQIKIGRRLLDKSRECLRRVFFLSYAWRLTNQEKYLKRAQKELLAVSAFSDWNPSHFLDVAEMTMAASIGYDWLYSGLTDSARTVIKDAIITKGLTPSLNETYNSWLKANHNWNQVCNAGMTFGALAIYEDDPRLALNIINRAIRTVSIPMQSYSPDGAYPEGYGYWGYGTSFNVLLISALEKIFHNDFGLSQQPGFLNTAYYMLNMTGPSGNCFNYSDSGLRGDFEPAMFWFAAQLNDPSVLWNERNRLMKSPSTELTGNRLLPAAIIWGRQISLKSVTEPKAIAWAGEGKNPVVLMRTSWTDPNAIYAGLKAGSPSVNHGHMDAGSFIMESDGVRWAMDLGMQGYESLESKGVDLWNMKQNSQRWQVFRYNNKAHNTLTVNDSLQLVQGYAPLVSYSVSPVFMNGITDLTDLYKDDLKSARRGVAVIDGKYVEVRDEIETGNKEASVRWTLLTPAQVQIVDKGEAILSQGGKKLVLKVIEPEEAELITWETTPTHPYDAPNPGTIFTGFNIRLPPSSKSPITVLLIPEKNASVSPQIQPLDEWPR